MRPAVRILKAEHLALKGIARVLKMEAIILERGGRADLAVLRDIAAYVAEFPMRFHHPKEEIFVFRPLAEQAPHLAPLLARLREQHDAEHGLIEDFQAAVAAGDLARIATLARRYAEFLEEHIRLEDHDLFPLAETALSPEAWARLDEAMAQHLDPLTAGGARFADLHARIMDLGLPPFHA